MKRLKYRLKDFVIPPERIERASGLFFEDIYNLRPREDKGLSPYEALVDPLSPTIVWPFPQVFFLKSQGLLLGNGSQESFNSSFVTTSIGTESAEFWDLADYGDWVILSNGLGTFNLTANVLSANDDDNVPDLKSICNFNGRIIGGGVLSSWHDCSEKSVVWAKPGEADFSIGSHNSSGYFANPGLGEIQRVLPLREGFLALGLEGIGFFPHLEVNGFGYQKISAQGCFDKKHSVSDGEKVYFLSENALFVTDGRKVEKLNFDWLLTSVTNPLLHINPLNGDLYIGGSNLCYVLSPNGLYRCYQSPLGIGFMGGYLYGISKESTDISSRLLSLSHDYSERGKKRFFSVHVGANNTSGHWGQARWLPRYGRQTFMTLPFTTISPDGLSFPLVNCEEAKLEILWPNRNTYVDWLSVEFAPTDSHANARWVNAHSFDS